MIYDKAQSQASNPSIRLGEPYMNTTAAIPPATGPAAGPGPAAKPPPAAPAFQTKQALVYRSLRERIMDGQLTPGQRLVIDDIAALYQVSPIPVREALHLLQAERLIEMRPHLGAVVAPISKDAIAEIFGLMECLELTAVRLAVPHVTHEHLAILDAAIEEMHELRGDYQQWAERNFAFHSAICAIAEMPRVREMTTRVFTEWERMRRWFFRDCAPPDLEHAHREHLAMVDAFRRRDLPRLERLTQEHNRGTLKMYLKLADRPRE
jgi:DNA-binding GntR family transcriptional regulator